MDAPEDRSKALNEHMSSGFAPRADIVAACRHVRFGCREETCNRLPHGLTSAISSQMLSNGIYRFAPFAANGSENLAGRQGYCGS
jgi:hypothetical protein